MATVINLLDIASDIMILILLQVDKLLSVSLVNKFFNEFVWKFIFPIKFIIIQKHIARELNDDILKRMGYIVSLKLWSFKNISDIGIYNLPNLTHLNLSRNYNITNDCVKQLTQLKSINLWANKMIEDNAIIKLTNLTSINLGYNKKITENCIGQLCQLTSIKLTGNRRITDNCLKKLTSLTHINLELNDEITDNGIQNLTSLMFLNIKHNLKITDDTFVKLPNCKILWNEFGHYKRICIKHDTGLGMRM